MPVSKIVLVRGNSGSGKSTVAKMLQHELGHGTLLLSQDAVRREVLWVNDGLDNPAAGLLAELVRYGARHCQVTILEGILYSEWYGGLFAAVEDCFPGRVFAYYFDVSFEETLQRHAQRPKASEFGEVEMRNWWNERDLLSGISEMLLPQHMSAEEIVDRICKDLLSHHHVGGDDPYF